jgi:hypothetical protein
MMQEHNQSYNDSAGRMIRISPPPVVDCDRPIAIGSFVDYVKSSPPSDIVLSLSVLRRGLHFSRYPIPGKWHHAPE